MNQTKKLLITGFLILIIFGLLSLIAFPYFAQCKGSSLELRVVKPKITALINEYRRKAGRWPKNFDEIGQLLHHDLEYDYDQTCDSWPNVRSRHGTLRGITLRRHSKSDFEGIRTYLVRFPKRQYDIKIYIDTGAVPSR